MQAAVAADATSAPRRRKRSRDRAHAGVARSTIQDNLHNTIRLRPGRLRSRANTVRRLAPTPTRLDAPAVYLASSSGQSMLRPQR
jgi:hypothetical protein